MELNTAMPLDNLEYIEGQSPLDEDEREGLLVPAVETWADLNEFEEINIQDALQWTLQSAFKPKVVLTENFVREVHRRMFGDVWSWAGDFRRSDKNIGVIIPSIFAMWLKKIIPIYQSIIVPIRTKLCTIWYTII